MRVQKVILPQPDLYINRESSPPQAAPQVQQRRQSIIHSQTRTKFKEMQNKSTGASICQSCGDSIEGSKKKKIVPVKEERTSDINQSTQTNLTLLREPLASLADQILLNAGKRRNTIVNNVIPLDSYSDQRKVLIMPKESTESQAKQGQQQLARSNNFVTKLSDPTILKILESAMEEMIRFEMTETSHHQQSSKASLFFISQASR